MAQVLADIAQGYYKRVRADLLPSRTPIWLKLL